MNEKIGRNDPCPCGSGKKYKQCCLLKSTAGKPLKFRAKVLSSQSPAVKMPAGPDLMDRTFGDKLTSDAPIPKPYKVTKPS